MDLLDLLQQLGLTRYEAAAYRALLAAGPLTGYELGKRSDVPLSRSYDTLERLLARGLVAVQPTTPPRYAAEDPARVIAQARAAHNATLDTLAAALGGLARPRPGDEFWVLRGRRAILDRAADLVAGTVGSLALAAPVAPPELAPALAAARARGVAVAERTLADPEGAEPLVLLVDDRLAIVGTLAPADRCQATVGGNPALLAAARAAVAAPARPALRPLPDPPPLSAADADRLSWLAWEDRKLRRLIGGQ